MGIGNQDETAFEFSGDWKEFAPIALTNGLLNVVTLSLYRFWATTRERDYLWSRTRFIDDQLEWTGTGLELFKGFLVALLLFALPWVVLTFGLQALLLQGYTAVAGLLGMIVVIFFFTLIGFAQFRALRYRLSRTEWHGIRGGSDSLGADYAWQAFWRTVVGYIPLTLMLPWAQTRLWQIRWSQMSFGPHAFQSNPSWEKMLGRYVICAFLGPIALVVVFAVLGTGAGLIFGSVGGGGEPGLFSIIFAGLFGLLIYVAFLAFPVAYYSAFFREGVDTLSLSTLDFQFTARTKDWLILFFGHGLLWVAAFALMAVIILPFGVFAAFSGLEPGMTPELGIGTTVVIVIAYLLPFSLVMPFIRYRNWRFFVRHMEAGGEINIANLTQSNTAREAQGEGLIDALDVGAF